MPGFRPASARSAAPQGVSVNVKAKLIPVAICLLAACGHPADPLPGFPRVVLWAWERPERLEFLDPRAAGVAYLARTISWRNGIVDSRPRMQPLKLPPGTSVMAVVRLESWTSPLPPVEEVARPLLADAANPAVRAVQIDFDARRSEREWYAALLQRVERGLGGKKPLGITALASWCLGDPWIRDLPVSDAVPMLFRLGRGEPRDVRDFSSGVCRASVGVATDELPYAIPHGRRVFVFAPREWTPESYRSALLYARRFE
jgi:hypothetical protein